MNNKSELLTIIKIKKLGRFKNLLKIKNNLPQRNSKHFYRDHHFLPPVFYFSHKK